MPHAPSQKQQVRALLPALAAAGLCWIASPAGAQSLEDLQKRDSRYIDWLREHQAAEVLAHYAKGASAADEKTKLSLRIAVADATIESTRVKARTAPAAEQAKIFAELRRSTEELLAAKRERCEKFADDESGLAWQTDLLSDQVDNYLRLYRNDAVGAVEAGSPDPDQVQAFADWIPVVFQSAVRAQATSDKVQKKMTADRRYTAALQKSGLRSRIEDAQVVAKYWLGASSYWMTLLPDAHPYFANLGKPGALVVPGQKPAAADERKRLLALAAGALEGSGTADGKALYACVLLAQGKGKEATAFAKAIDLAEYTDPSAAPLAARVIVAKARISAATGSLDEAVRDLRSQAAGNPAIAAELAGGRATSYLFVCDAASRLLMDASKKAKPPQDVELFNKAFLDPYADVLGEKPPAGMDEAAAKAVHDLRTTLFQRWKAQFASTPADKLPGVIALETLNLEFSDIFSPGGPWSDIKKVVDDKGSPDPAKVKALAEKARHLETGLSAAVEKEKVAVVRAKLLNQRALTRYLGAQAGVFLSADPKNTAVAEADQSVRAAAMDWVALADTASASADAPQAIDYATALLHALHEHNLFPKDYAAACKVLFEKYGKTKAAVRELPYYAGVLDREGKTAAALKLLDAMPKDDEYYFVAQQKALTLRERARKAAQAESEAKKGTPDAAAAEAKLGAAADAVIRAASALEDEAKAAGKSGTAGYHRASARFVQASTVIIHANALAAKGAAVEGVSLLDKFETTFAPETALLPEDFEGKPADLENMRKYLGAQVEYAQVSRMRMLMDAGQGDQVKGRAQDLLASGKPQALLVLKGLLRDIRLEVDRLTASLPAIKYEPLKVELKAKRQRYGQAMLDLTTILRDKLLATADKPNKEYLDLLFVQAKAASGDTAGAVAEVAKLLADEAEQVKKDPKYPRSLNLLLVASQTYFDHAASILDPASKDRKALLKKAYQNAKSIVDNFTARGPGADGFPAEFYGAFWTQLASVEAMDPSSPSIRAIRANIPNSIDTIRELDPKGFGELEWNDRFIALKDRIVVENQSGK